jgi:hypothetical protein
MKGKSKETLSKEIGKKYKTIDVNIEKLNESKHKDGNTNTNIIISFYPRVVSDADITFSREQVTYLIRD